MKITLKAARINAGYSQRVAADLLDVSKSTLGNWESGKTFPSAEKIKKIESVYHVEYNDLIFFTH